MATGIAGIPRATIARNLLVAGAVAAALGLPQAHAADEVKLPKSMVWSAYDLGSSGYTDASGMANALQTKYETRVRIVPSGTSIGRLLPMTTGRVNYGFLGNETYFASEASEDFAVKQWGPQDLRVLLGRPSPIGMATTRCDDLGIKTMADLRGKKIGYVKGNPSQNVKSDAMLAFGGLTSADVEVVWFGGWGQQLPAVLSGQIDVMQNVPSSGQARQIEASPGGLCWPPMPADDKEGWARAQKVASFLNPIQATAGAALSPEKPVPMAGYRYPMIATYASTSDDETYALTKALHLTFDMYKNATAAAEGWVIDEAGHPPYDAPTHPGTIRYMKELGKWGAEDQSWNDNRLERMAAVQKAWDVASAEFDTWREAEIKKGNKVDEEAGWLEYWTKYRAANLDK